MRVIPSFAQSLLGQFASVFSQPTYQRFLVLLVAAILATGRRNVSNLLRTVPGLAPGGPSSYHRVLSKRRWSATRLARLLVKFLLDNFVAEGPVFLAGDDTVDEHRGAKVHGKGCHRDPVHSTHSFTAYRWGHKWVVLTILVKFPFAVRPGALPVLVALYRCADKDETKAKTKKDMTKAKRRRGGKTPTQVPTPKRRHKTPSELMRQLLAVLIHRFPERQFVFAGDGGYGTHALARFAHRHAPHLSLVRLFYPNASLYDPPPEVVGKRNGRPRQKGAKRPAPEAVVAATSEPTAGNVSWYGGGRREVEAVRGTGQWFKSGKGLVPMLWVFVQDRTGTHRDSYLFSTDLTLTVAEVIETYAEPRAVAYRGKTEVAFSDAITAVRRQLWLKGVFEGHAQTEVFENLPRPFQAVLLAALAPAA